MESAPIVVAMTGASGAVYGLGLIARLLAAGRSVELMLSAAGCEVLGLECGLDWRLASDREIEAAARGRFGAAAGKLRYHGRREWSSFLASGSGGRRSMVVCPCSMGTLAAVAGGLSDNLIERAADVAIKERWPLILVPREMPLSAIHLENMLKLARLGVTIMPAAPGFHHRPTGIEGLVDFVVARIMDHLGVAHRLIPPWDGGGAVGT
ncbi:MAG: UbiX family flavin prenyltransferase [Magnetococcales bacterium]|nr:UbiX family flavin prenyltransferase [Magnetococcales bacterium]MBF0155609.1 UbiX family flavin prenyltransferase [Magnetococcales bacterium]